MSEVERARDWHVVDSYESAFRKLIEEGPKCGSVDDVMKLARQYLDGTIAWAFKYRPSGPPGGWPNNTGSLVDWQHGVYGKGWVHELDRTCLSYWYPKIKDVVPTPKTEIVQTDCKLWELLDGNTPDGYYGFLDQLTAAAIRIDGLIEDGLAAVFLRTGHTSGKHNWGRCCYLDHDLDGYVRVLVEFSAMGLPTEVWAIRESLPVDPLFRCVAYSGMPVVPERRYFVDGGKLLYSIPYWPEQALEEGEPDDETWRQKLPIVQQPFEPKADEMAIKCGEACGGKWSVDVLLTRKGYYVTDMAEAEKSWGWQG